MDHKVIAKSYGIKINYDNSPALYFGWDGTQINAKDIPENDILHEIAHYICSPEQYRNYVNFYLGYGPDEDPKLYSSMMKEKFPGQPDSRLESQDEEELTCLLEFIFAGLYQPLKVIKNTMSNRHYMVNNGSKIDPKIKQPYWKSCVSRLQDKNIIDENWTPVVLKNNNLIKKIHLKNLDRFKNLINQTSN